MDKPYFQDSPTPEILRSYIKECCCWICGKGGWKALSQHLVKAHGLPAAEVREMAYMLKRERLISEELSEFLSKDALRRFGDKLKRYEKGVKQPERHYSSKAKDILRKRAKEIRPLAAIALEKTRIPHNCPVCGRLIPTSKPIHCTPECSHIAASESAKKAMTPERIAQFKRVLYKPTPEEQSIIAKEYWRKFKELPPEEQRRLNLEHAASRRVRVYKNCIICGVKFDVIPSHADEQVTCGRLRCKRQNQSNKSKGRKHSAESIAKMSAYAKKRHEREGGLFGRTAKRCSQTVMELSC